MVRESRDCNVLVAKKCPWNLRCCERFANLSVEHKEYLLSKQHKIDAKKRRKKKVPLELDSGFVSFEVCYDSNSKLVLENTAVEQQYSCFFWIFLIF